jgi:hypothetical protein
MEVRTMQATTKPETAIKVPRKQELEPTEELTLEEVSELVEEALALRWSSKPTTASKRCC